MQQETINGTEYRLIQQHLYVKKGDAFVHCAIIPSKFGKSIRQAVRWYEKSE